MGTPDNYIHPTPSPQELKMRVSAVIESASMIRKEINRIRNEALSQQMDLPRPMMAALRMLQLTTVTAAIEYCYMMGVQGEEFSQLQACLLNPHQMLSNEDLT